MDEEIHDKEIHDKEIHDEKIYNNTVYNLTEALEEKTKFKTQNIYGNNIEIIIQEINGKIIKEDGISISFQKQNGSFVFASKNSINEILKEQILDIVNNSSNAELFAAYNFSDMKEFNVYHYIYDNSKINFNTNILNSFNDLHQIENLKYKI